MDMQREIIAAIKRKVTVAPNNVWTFQMYIGFYNDLSSEQKKEFDVCMDNWCEKGWFLKKEQYAQAFDYQITETGAKMLESEDTEF